MNRITKLDLLPGMLRPALAALLVCLGGQAHALVEGWEGETATCAAPDPCGASGIVRTFVLTARDDFVSTSDGNSHYAWGYAPGTDFVMQYPGPTLFANQGDVVNVVLNNTLPVNASIVFPGQDVTATGGVAGLVTREAPGVPVTDYRVVAGPTYTFVATNAGTYQYHSGTNPDLQIEMGMVGALIVRPSMYNVGSKTVHPDRKAYPQAGTEYDREHLFVLTEMDPDIHWQVYGQVFAGGPINVDTTKVHATMWFINGRNAPDTLAESHAYWLPTQPYNAVPRMHPGERLLMRVVNAGRDLHPFHHHGNHAIPVARDGRVLSSNPGDTTQVPDLSSPDFTVRAIPGQTMDLIYEWTGKGLGWDIYGTTDVNPHACNGDATTGWVDPVSKEWCPDHNKPIPVKIPGQLDIAFGEYWSGTPFLGVLGTLPEGHPGLNTTGGYYQMWHSHNELEITTDDIFPGGMMTMLIIEPPTVELEPDSALPTP